LSVEVYLMKFRWRVEPSQPLLAGQLAKQLNLLPLVVQCLLNRGFSDPELINRFLEPRLKHLSDPFLLPNMAAAVDRLFRAREAGEALAIFGDYDVDGVTSTTLLSEVLTALGWKVHCFLPHRIDDGYGLSTEAVEKCLTKHKVSLLLAVDCGSTSVTQIAALKARGVDVVVVDHHQISNPAPDAVALINPQLTTSATKRGADCPPDFHELCSAGSL